MLLLYGRITPNPPPIDATTSSNRLLEVHRVGGHSNVVVVATGTAHGHGAAQEVALGRIESLVAGIP